MYSTVVIKNPKFLSLNSIWLLDGENKIELKEFIVIRTANEIVDTRIGRVSFKTINPDFLLKYKDE